MRRSPASKDDLDIPSLLFDRREAVGDYRSARPRNALRAAFCERRSRPHPLRRDWRNRNRLYRRPDHQTNSRTRKQKAQSKPPRASAAPIAGLIVSTKTGAQLIKPKFLILNCPKSTARV